MTTVQYLDAAKTALKISSDYALAKALGITRSAVSGYRAGRSTLAPLVAARVAAILGIDELRVIADIEMERSTSPAHRELWQRIRDAAMLAAFAIGAAFGAPPPASAGTSHNQNWSINGPQYTLRVFFRALARALGAAT